MQDRYAYYIIASEIESSLIYYIKESMPGIKLGLGSYKSHPTFVYFLGGELEKENPNNYIYPEIKALIINIGEKTFLTLFSVSEYEKNSLVSRISERSEIMEIKEQMASDSYFSELSELIERYH